MEVNMPRKIIPEKVEEAKGKIIYAALDVIIEDGLSKFTLTKVANKAGITKAAIYWYFTSKEDLLNYMASSFRESFIESGKQVAAQPISLERKIEGIILSLENDDTQKKCFLPIKVFVELYSSDHEIKNTIKEIYTEYIGILQGIFEKALDKGEIKTSITALSLAKILMALLDGCTIQDEISGNPRTNYKEVHRLFMSFLTIPGGQR